jgi:hypothetical protein
MGVQFNDDADTRNRVKELQRELKELAERVTKLESQAKQCTHCEGNIPHLRSGTPKDSYAF